MVNIIDEDLGRLRDVARIARPSEAELLKKPLMKECFDTLPQLIEEVERLRKELSELWDWIKMAQCFTWAHDETCPRYNDDAGCNCGLDDFLAFPRPTVESFKEEVARLLRGWDA